MATYFSTIGNKGTDGIFTRTRLARAASWCGAMVCHLVAVVLLFVMSTKGMDMVDRVMVDVSRLLGGVLLIGVGLWVELHLLPADFLEE